MSSSVKSPEPVKHPLAADGGITTVPPEVKDPFAVRFRAIADASNRDATKLADGLLSHVLD